MLSARTRGQVVSLTPTSHALILSNQLAANNQNRSEPPTPTYQQRSPDREVRTRPGPALNRMKIGRGNA